MPTQRLQFEHFEILTNDDGSLVKLGRGGMGTTYKSFDNQTPLKVSGNPEQREYQARAVFGETEVGHPSDIVEGSLSRGKCYPFRHSTNSIRVSDNEGQMPNINLPES